MSDRRDFVRAYRETEEALASRHPSEELDRRFEHALSRRRTGVAVVGALVAIAAATVLWIVARDVPDAALPSQLSIAEVSTRRLDAEHVIVEAVRAVNLVRDESGPRIVEGSARFVLGAVERTSPLRLSVMDAYIEGTEAVFFIDVTPRGGYVELEEGRIAFVAANGARTVLAPGDFHRWGDVAERWADDKIEIAVASVTDLLTRGRHAEAERQIEALLSAPIGSRAAEVLSFERGTVLEDKLNRHDDACRHWHRHQARFSRGRYDDVVASALDGCTRGNSTGSER